MWGLREDFLENRKSALRLEEANEKGWLREFQAEKIPHRSLGTSGIFGKLKESHYEQSTLMLEKNVGT